MKHKRNLIKIALIAFMIRSITLALILLIPKLNLVPVFDSSARSMGSLEGLVRWDVLHFLSIYRHGDRTVEQQWAFGKGITWVLSLGHSLVPQNLYTQEQAAILGGSLLALFASVLSTVMLYLLTMELTTSSQFSFLTSLLHILSPSPSTQVVVYTEPFFALFTFTGMLGFARLDRCPQRRLKIAFCLFRLTIAGLWAISTSFRPLGVMMAGFWGWDWLQQSLRRIRTNPTDWVGSSIFIGIRAIETAVLVLITCAPFIYDQYQAYLRFCLNRGGSDLFSPRPWCSYTIPAIYPFVQSHYWDVGFLRYWTLSQIPNFIISMPLYFLSFSGISTYYRLSRPNTSRPFLKSRLIIYIHLQLILTLILFFNSHVQIILRQAASIPGIWWALADQVGSGWGLWPGDKNGKWWWIWCGLWGPISVLLWIGFYPPA
ncbi:GPI mannosyltransferase 2 [Melampsora americana]|nr:GPI mannosyltransferase 2 [Melampsora americana]